MSVQLSRGRVFLNLTNHFNALDAHRNIGDPRYKDGAWGLRLLRLQSDNEPGCVKAVALRDAEVKNTPGDR